MIALQAPASSASTRNCEKGGAAFQGTAGTTAQWTRRPCREKNAGPHPRPLPAQPSAPSRFPCRARRARCGTAGETGVESTRQPSRGALQRSLTTRHCGQRGPRVQPRHQSRARQRPTARRSPCHALSRGTRRFQCLASHRERHRHPCHALHRALCRRPRLSALRHEAEARHPRPPRPRTPELARRCQAQVDSSDSTACRAQRARAHPFDSTRLSREEALAGRAAHPSAHRQRACARRGARPSAPQTSTRARGSGRLFGRPTQMTCARGERRSETTSRIE